MNNECCKNTDKEVWRAKVGDYYSPSIHVTECGGIGIDCHGHVIVASIEEWHKAGEKFLCINPDLSSWRRKIGRWLLKLDKPIKYKKV